MSRTDKDRPYWLEYGDWVEAHICNRPWTQSWSNCDIPEFPPDKVIRPRTFGVMKSGWTWCAWERRSERKHYSNRYHIKNVPKWYVDHVYHNPMRRDNRDMGRRAVAEYRATGDIDAEFEVRQARNDAKWYWW